MIILLFALMLIIGIGFLFKWITNYKDFGVEVNEENGFKFLLGWITIGFLTRLDYSDRWGCVIRYEPIFEPINIMFSLISFAAIFLAFRTDNKRIKKIICLIELFYWIAKLLIFKGGYVAGYAGGSDITIVFYDSVSMIARLFIISQIIENRNYSVIKIGIITLLVLGIKISLFSTPIYMMYENMKTLEKAKEVKKELVGRWNGKVKKIKDEEVEFEEITNISIDSSNIIFDNLTGLENRYQLILRDPEYGALSKDGRYQNYGFFIERRSRDSLFITLYDMFEVYKFKLGKE